MLRYMPYAPLMLLLRLCRRHAAAFMMLLPRHVAACYLRYAALRCHLLRC